MSGPGTLKNSLLCGAGRCLLATLLLLCGGCGGDSAQTAGASGSSPTVGYVGASLTLGAVDGYRTLGGTNLWPDGDAASSYPGGSVSAWYLNLTDTGNPNNRWRTFAALLANNSGTNRIWWHLCPRASTTDSIPTYDQALAVLNRIKEETNAEIYATAASVMPAVQDRSEYDALSGYLATMISQGLVKKGPDLTPLTLDQLGADGHPNEAGKAVWGKDLQSFFDGAL